MKLPPFYQDVLHALDPAALASQRRIEFRNGRVAVEVGLAADENDLAALYDLHILGRTDPYLYALVPIHNLCALSNDPRVGVMRVPYAPAPAS